MIYRFANCRLETRTFDLRRGGVPVRVQPQVFDLLRFLIENRARVVGKDDLLAAVWKGRIVSEVTLSSRVNAARRAVGDDGSRQEIIRTVPRRGFRFVAPVVVEGDAPELYRVAAGGSASPLAVEPAVGHGVPVPGGPTIAVLPFLNLSGDPRQECFVDGVVEEIITSLSQMRSLNVVSRASTFVYKGRSVDARAVGKVLGADYILTGSVRRSGDKVRLNTQLADARSGENLWADRIQGVMSDLFRLQDELADAAIGSIEPSLLRAEIGRAARKPPKEMRAYDYYLRSLPCQFRPTPKRLALGLGSLGEALAIDPHYAPANATAAMMHFFRVAFGWSSFPADDSKSAVRLARAAMDGGEDHAGALSQAGFVLASVGMDVEVGAAVASRAVEVGPASALALAHSGWVLTLAGDQQTALDRLQASLHLSPSDPIADRTLTGCAAASVLAGRFEDAVAFCHQSLHRNARFGPTYRFLAAARAQLGEGDKARKAMARLQALEPTVTISHLRHLLPYRDATQGHRVWDGLREAGMAT